MKTQKLIISLIAATLLMGCNNSEGLQLLRVEALEEPTAIDNPTPDFSWQLRSDKQATEQLSYQIKVATDSQMSNLVWDSGVVNNGESHGILYGSTGQAAPLQPETEYFWQVTIRDNH
ncbi:MAG: alpha-rhamnosidase, partial [Tidjanibacter sp.]|nr:alpha-rhamnosidase [Tidjanibacter sp.]